MARNISELIASTSSGQKVEFKDKYAASYISQISLSITRWMRCFWRDVPYNLTRITIVAAVSLLFSVAVTGEKIYEIHDQPSLQTFNGAFFSGVFFTAAIQSVVTVRVLGESKIVYYREQAAGMYSPFAYLLGLTVAEIPWLTLITSIHVMIFYPISHMHNDSEYLAHYWLAMFLFCCMFCFWGQMLSALLPSTEVASLLCGASIGMMNMFSGFFMPESDIPWPWKLFYYMSPARFGLKAAIPKQFWCDLSCIGDGIDCQSDMSLTSLGAGKGPYNGSGPGCSVMVDATGYVALKKGAEFLSSNGINPSPGYRVTVWDYWSSTTETYQEDVWEFTFGILGFLVAFRLVTLVALSFLKHIKR